ncbi:MAG: Crp/Fnr family transcriptional regulator [Pseudomonadales bacterium]|nr:Crp/Fnr family transcriptional regulator [Pseudomonadales bacterium]
MQQFHKEWQSYKKQFPTVTTAAWNDIQAKGVFQEFASGEYLLRAGEPAINTFWLISGVCREFFMTLDGKEFNKAFSIAGQVTGSLYDLNLGEPSTVTIEFIRPSRGLLLPFQEVKALCDRHESFNRLYYGLLEALFMKKSRREYELLTLSASDRFKRFKELYPDLDRQIPLYHIASYLGITPEALSRIRKNSP